MKYERDIEQASVERQSEKTVIANNVEEINSETERSVIVFALIHM